MRTEHYGLLQYCFVATAYVTECNYAFYDVSEQFLEFLNS